MIPLSLAELITFIAGFGLSAAGGLAALLRSKAPLKWRVIASTILYSGMLGLVVAMLCYGTFASTERIPVLLSICGLSGLSGQSFAMKMVEVLSKGGLRVIIRGLEGLESRVDPDLEEQETEDSLGSDDIKERRRGKRWRGRDRDGS